MKTWKKIAVIIIAVLAIFSLITYSIFIFKGKSIIVSQLEKMTHKKVTIGYFGLAFPLQLGIRNLNIERFLKADYISISPNIFGFLTGSVVINSVNIINPEFTYIRQPPLKVPDSFTPQQAVAQISDTQLPPRAPTAGARLANYPRLLFKHFKIKGGTFTFIDRTVTSDGLKIIMKDINLSVTNMYFYPSSTPTNFDFNARIPWSDNSEAGKVNLKGWIEPMKRNIEAVLKIDDIDGVYLYPYYKEWVDLQKARIAKAKLSFTSHIHGLDNNILARCHLELTDIVRKQLEPGENNEKASRITDAVLDIFKAFNQGKIAIDFDIPTKMDKPEFGFGNIKEAFENKLAQRQQGTDDTLRKVAAFPLRLLEGMVRGGTELTKAVVSGTFAVGNEIKKSVEDTFKKEPEKKQPAQ